MTEGRKKIRESAGAVLGKQFGLPALIPKALLRQLQKLEIK